MLRVPVVICVCAHVHVYAYEHVYAHVHTMNHTIVTRNLNAGTRTNAYDHNIVNSLDNCCINI